jgi:hypothetical protein
MKCNVKVKYSLIVAKSFTGRYESGLSKLRKNAKALGITI